MVPGATLDSSGQNQAHISTLSLQLVSQAIAIPDTTFSGSASRELRVLDMRERIDMFNV